MKSILRSASSAAILVGVAGALPAFAQDAGQPPAAAAQESVDRVVVTGSFIQGTPEDAALPVEVYSQEELEAQGSPSALEFAKNLSIAGPTTGEAYYFGGAQNTGSVQYNLRGLGADKTLTLLNGRRVNENTSTIPSIALARTEVLKDGAAVIYGADATGGVVNFMTRDNFVGLEARANYKFIADSDGDYGVGLLGGFGEGQTNFLWAAEWEHRSRLSTKDRNFSSLPAAINPAPTSFITNMATWRPATGVPATATTSANEYGTLGGFLPDFTNASCNAVGGFVDPRAISNALPACVYNYASYYNLVEENDIYRGYAQVNSDIDENMSFHADVSYAQVKSPQVYGSPAQPTTRGPARAGGLSYQFFAPDENPYVASFLASKGVTGADGVVPVLYRAFAHGGNPVMGDGNGFGVPSMIDRETWRISSSLDGTLSETFGFMQGVNYNFGVTYNNAKLLSTAPEIQGWKLQEALAGFGGPNCNVTDQNPYQFGTQNTSVGSSASARAALGCLYWNPFSTSFPNQPALGLDNISYVPGAEIPPELVRWIFDERKREQVNEDLTVDLVFSGQAPLTLPGGDVSWALGGQWRNLEQRVMTFGDAYNGNLQCDWPERFTTGVVVGGQTVAVSQRPLSPTDPLFTGCGPFATGPFLFFDIEEPSYQDRQQYSLFGELQIPLLDNVNLQAAVRREEFSGGLGNTVYKVSGKWDVFGPLSFRGSYGTNYQAPPITLIPGNINNGTASYTSAGSQWLGAQTYTQEDIQPETATSWNIGAIWQSEGFATDHNFRIIVDYFDIETEDEFGLLASHNQLANYLFPTVAGSTTRFANCSSPLISRVTFNGGACVQGVTTSTGFSSIRTDFGNGPSQQTAGIDFQIEYDLPMFSGDVTFGVNGTNMTKLVSAPAVLDGVEVVGENDRLGFLNFGDFTPTAQSAPEWKVNAFVNYGLDRHNFRFQTNYVSGVVDERGPRPAPAIGIGATQDFGVDGDDWLAFDFTYLFDVTETLRLTASINNILDKDPPFSPQELGYDPLIGNPLGRTFEFAVKKVF